MAIGILAMKLIKKAQGLEVIPNIEFWEALPGLVKVGTVRAPIEFICTAYSILLILLAVLVSGGCLSRSLIDWFINTTVLVYRPKVVNSKQWPTVTTEFSV